jgi:triphosphatase
LRVAEFPPSAEPALAPALHQDIAMTESLHSKADRGGQPAFGAPSAVARTDLPRLDPALPVAGAFELLVHAILGHWLANQSAALDGQAEGVHQMRIAIRRLKTLFNLFRPYIAKSDYASVRDTLTRTGRVLGRARDWDVFIGETLAAAARKPRTRAVARRIAAAAGPPRARSQREVAKTIHAPAYTMFMLHMNHRLKAQRRQVAIDGGPAASIADVSGRLLERQAHKARRAGKRVRGLSAKRRHDLRKKLKKLRYSVEFLAELYEARPVERYMARLRQVLDGLGELNDLAVARERFVDAAGSKPNAGGAARALRKRWAHRKSTLLRGLPDAWRRFEKVKPFWDDPTAAVR